MNHHIEVKGVTFPETNLATESLGLEDVVSFWGGLLAGAVLVYGGYTLERLRNMDANMRVWKGLFLLNHW